jgi:hypothetical protein
MAGRRHSLRKMEYVGRCGLAFGPRCVADAPSSIGLPKWPQCSGCCLAQHSNLVLKNGPELRSPARLRCGDRNGRATQTLIENGCTNTKIRVDQIADSEAPERRNTRIKVVEEFMPVVTMTVFLFYSQLKTKIITRIRNVTKVNYLLMIT